MPCGTAGIPISVYQRRLMVAGAQWMASSQRKYSMHAAKDLFTSDVGLLSLASIAFMLGMGGFYLRYFLRHMHEDEAKQRAR